MGTIQPSTMSNLNTSVLAIPPFFVRSIDDRAYWSQFDRLAQFQPFLTAIDGMVAAGKAQGRPPEPLATDFLAAKRENNRKRIDDHWQFHRGTLGALCFNRCRHGIDANDPDDTLLNWLWSALNTPTWCVSNHLPKYDLPEAGKHRLDLAQCEMAVVLAETLEALKPWMETVSETLAKSIAYEIDRRVLTPFAEGITDDWWGRSASHINNWTGVCAGSILAACEALERVGHPRHPARARALDHLRLFADAAFTREGECDEGVSYWLYGVGFACIGWMRLSTEELSRELDMNRLRQIASYPGRAHLFENTFFSANDAQMHSLSSPFFVPWLGKVTNDPFLPKWPASLSPWNLRCFPVIARTVDALLADAELVTRPAVPAGAEPARFLNDQQVAMFSVQRLSEQADEKTRVIACLSGGDNNERHNHNDLGHFTLAVDGKIVLPDLGAPVYRNDFFGPKRYTYLSASSRGHCCPIVDGYEQRPGKDAAAILLDYDPANLRMSLDLTSAYPPEAALRKWTRTLAVGASDGVVSIDDQFKLRPQGVVTHVIWSLEEAVQLPNAEIDLGPVRLAVTGSLVNVVIEKIDPNDHLLRMVDWLKSVRGTERVWIYRIAFECIADDVGQLQIESRFTPR